MKKIIIAAVAENGVIGRGNEMPWHFPEDLRMFKRETTGHAIIMGRKTFESVGSRPLPNRLNVIVSRSLNAPDDPNVKIARSLDEAFALCLDCEKVFVAGGAEVYRQAMDQVDEAWLTVIPGEYEGDTLFPCYPLGDQWRLYDEQQGKTVVFRRYRLAAL